jgi:hypothetical protein
VGATQRGRAARGPALTTPADGGGTSTGPSSSDQTAGAGPQFERAKRLLETLRGMVPAGYTVSRPPTEGEPTPTGTEGVPPPAAFQAVHDGRGFEGWTGWYYDGYADLDRAGGTGTVGVKVWTQIPAWSANPCRLLERLYWVRGTCTVVTVAGKQVALSNRAPGNPPGGFDYRADQWAASRSPAGTVVMILQARHTFLPQTPALTSPVFSSARLAALAADRRFAF